MCYYLEIGIDMTIGYRDPNEIPHSKHVGGPVNANVEENRRIFGPILPT